jgi:D-alanine-D-alanine ligase
MYQRVQTTSKIAVFMGGQSAEHEISILSGNRVVPALEKQGYAVVPVTITPEGEWLLSEERHAPHAALTALHKLGIDCVFIALHGPYGEDGRVQGMLDMLGLPYTGSGCAASGLAMDKVRCKAVVQAQGIRVAGHIALDRATWAADPEQVKAAVSEDLRFPCVVKAPCQGSSKGLEIPQDLDGFVAAVEKIFEMTDYLMVEEYISGTEVTCGVLDAEPNGMMRPLPVTEIRPKTAAYFDYEAKYTPGATDEITPAPLPQDVTSHIMDMAVHAHEIVGCAGWSRSDFIIDNDGPVWIEINTVPGLTETSLYPQAAAAAGISYEEMVGLFVEAALRKHATDKG